MFKLHQRGAIFAVEDFLKLRTPHFTIKLGWRRGTGSALELEEVGCSSPSPGTSEASALSNDS
jgi:hypothetical protein